MNNCYLSEKINDKNLYTLRQSYEEIDIQNLSSDDISYDEIDNYITNFPFSVGDEYIIRRGAKGRVDKNRYDTQSIYKKMMVYGDDILGYHYWIEIKGKNNCTYTLGLTYAPTYQKRVKQNMLISPDIIVEAAKRQFDRCKILKPEIFDPNNEIHVKALRKELQDYLYKSFSEEEITQLAFLFKIRVDNDEPLSFSEEEITQIAILLKKRGDKDKTLEEENERFEEVYNSIFALDDPLCCHSNKGVNQEKCSEDLQMNTDDFEEVASGQLNEYQLSIINYFLKNIDKAEEKSLQMYLPSKYRMYALAIPGWQLTQKVLDKAKLTFQNFKAGKLEVGNDLNEYKQCQSFAMDFHNYSHSLYYRLLQFDTSLSTVILFSRGENGRPTFNYLNVNSDKFKAILKKESEKLLSIHHKAAGTIKKKLKYLRTLKNRFSSEQIYMFAEQYNTTFYISNIIHNLITVFDSKTEPEYLQTFMDLLKEINKNPNQKYCRIESLKSNFKALHNKFKKMKKIMEMPDRTLNNITDGQLPVYIYSIANPDNEMIIKKYMLSRKNTEVPDITEEIRALTELYKSYSGSELTELELENKLNLSERIEELKEQLEYIDSIDSLDVDIKSKELAKKVNLNLRDYNLHVEFLNEYNEASNEGNLIKKLLKKRHSVLEENKIKLKEQLKLAYDFEEKLNHLTNGIDNRQGVLKESYDILQDQYEMFQGAFADEEVAKNLLKAYKLQKNYFKLPAEGNSTTQEINLERLTETDLDSGDTISEGPTIDGKRTFYKLIDIKPGENIPIGALHRISHWFNEDNKDLRIENDYYIRPIQFHRDNNLPKKIESDIKILYDGNNYRARLADVDEWVPLNYDYVIETTIGDVSNRYFINYHTGIINDMSKCYINLGNLKRKIERFEARDDNIVLRLKLLNSVMLQAVYYYTDNRQGDCSDAVDVEYSFEELSEDEMPTPRKLADNRIAQHVLANIHHKFVIKNNANASVIEQYYVVRDGEKTIILNMTLD